MNLSIFYNLQHLLVLFLDDLQELLELRHVRLSSIGRCVHVHDPGGQRLVLAPLPLQFLRMAFHLLCSTTQKKEEKKTTR